VGFTTAYLSVIVLLPLAALAWEARGGDFWHAVTTEQSIAALKLTLVVSLIVSLINAVAGTAIAWILVRDRFVETLDDAVTTGRFFELRKSEHDTKADEQHQDDHGARREALKHASHQRYRISHLCSATLPVWEAVPSSTPDRGALPPWRHAQPYAARPARARNQTAGGRRAATASP